MKRSQASGWAAGMQPRNTLIPVLKGSLTLKAASPEAQMASQRGTGGVLDCGTAEEDGPVTWETPDRPVGAVHVQRVRRDRGQTGGVLKRQGSRRAEYER